MAELWPLRDDLYLAIQLGMNFLEMELDAKVIVEMLNSTNCSNKKYSLVLHDCRFLLSRLTEAWWSMFLERQTNAPIFWLGRVAL